MIRKRNYLDGYGKPKTYHKRVHVAEKTTKETKETEEEAIVLTPQLALALQNIDWDLLQHHMDSIAPKQIIPPVSQEERRSVLNKLRNAFDGPYVKNRITGVAMGKAPGIMLPQLTQNQFRALQDLFPAIQRRPGRWFQPGAGVTCLLNILPNAETAAHKYDDSSTRQYSIYYGDTLLLRTTAYGNGNVVLEYMQGGQAYGGVNPTLFITNPSRSRYLEGVTSATTPCTCFDCGRMTRKYSCEFEEQGDLKYHYPNMVATMQQCNACRKLIRQPDFEIPLTLQLRFMKITVPSLPVENETKRENKGEQSRGWYTESW